MPGSLSDYLENKALDHAFKGTTFTRPGTYYLGLSTADPLDDKSGLAEPVGNGYARVDIGGFAAASGRVITNSGQIQFPTATGAWGSITHFAVFDSLTSGNMLAHGLLTNPLNVVSTNAPVFQIGELSITVNSGAWSNYLANAMLDHLFGGASFTQPSNVYLAFSTANPTDDGSGIAEPVGNGYARTEITAFAAAAAGSKANSAQVQFPAATGAWGTIAYGAIFDASTSGNMLAYGAANNPYSVISGNAPLVDTGQLTLTVD